MRGLLLDTHILLDLLSSTSDPLDGIDAPPGTVPFVSVCSLWEMAIKVRQGKLRFGTPVAELQPTLDGLGCRILPVTGSHAIAEVEPWPDTNDPFDRLLLAVCAVESLRLVTRDSKLVGHPLAWRPASA